MKKRFEPIAGRCREIVGFIMSFPQMPQDDSLNFKIRLCCEETVQNVIDYAYPGGEGYLEVEVLLEETSLSISFIDSGIPFNPLGTEVPDVNAALEERQVGGLGIFLCRKIMDRLDYSRAGDCNCFTMYKDI